MHGSTATQRELEHRRYPDVSTDPPLRHAPRGELMGLIVHCGDATLICDSCFLILPADAVGTSPAEGSEPEPGRTPTTPKQIVARAVETGWREDPSRVRWTCPACRERAQDVGT